MFSLKRKIKIFILSFVLAVPFCVQAQVNQSQKSFKRNAAAVIFASLGGGVLGLSTLSFYGRPQEHTDNITTGVAIGLVAGLVYIFSDVADTQTQEVQSPWIPESSTPQINTKTEISIPVFLANFKF